MAAQTETTDWGFDPAPVSNWDESRCRSDPAGAAAEIIGRENEIENYRAAVAIASSMRSECDQGWAWLEEFCRGDETRKQQVAVYRKGVTDGQ